MALAVVFEVGQSFFPGRPGFAECVECDGHSASSLWQSVFNAPPGRPVRGVRVGNPIE